MRNFPSAQTGIFAKRFTRSCASQAAIIYPYPEQNVVGIKSIISAWTLMTQGWFRLDVLESQAVTSTNVKSALESGVEHAIARLDEFESLEEDWDSYGAPAIDKAMLEEARKVLKSLRDNLELIRLTGLEFHPYPSPTGGVAIDFEYQDREIRLKLYPNKNDRIVFRVLKSKPEKYIYKQFTYRFTELSSHFKWLGSVD